MCVWRMQNATICIMFSKKRIVKSCIIDGKGEGDGVCVCVCIFLLKWKKKGEEAEIKQISPLTLGNR